MRGTFLFENKKPKNNCLEKCIVDLYVFFCSKLFADFSSEGGIQNFNVNSYSRGSRLTFDPRLIGIEVLSSF